MQKYPPTLAKHHKFILLVYVTLEKGQIKLLKNSNFEHNHFINIIPGSNQLVQLKHPSTLIIFFIVRVYNFEP